MRFGEAAARLAGLAAQALGWRPDEFWSATPMELSQALRGDEPAIEPVGRDELQRLMGCHPDGEW